MKIKKDFYLSGLCYALIIGLSTMVSCKKVASEPEQSETFSKSDTYMESDQLVDSTHIEVSLEISATVTGVNVPDHFIGLSYEKSDLVNPTWPYFNSSQTTFLQLLKNLNTGVLRLGGNSSDKIFWLNSLRGSSTSVTEVYQDDVNKLKLFMDALGGGWKLMYGLNLATDSVHTTEVDYVMSQFGNKVLSFEIGNEPDLYPQNGYRATGYGIVDYKPEFESSYNILHAAIPTAPFSGPTVSSKTAWVQAFASDEASRISFLTTHYYKLGSTATIAQLMQYDSTLVSRSGIIATAATSSGLPFRYSECNSVNNGGKDGVSNVFASALWGTDMMFYLAAKGVTGVDFHGGRRSYYSPLYYNTNGTFSVKPLYYSLLLFKLAEMKQPLLSTLNTNGLNLTAYTFKNATGKSCALIINKDEEITANCSLNHSTVISSAKIYELSTTASSALSATTDITLGGTAVNSTNGTWTVGSGTALSGNGTAQMNITINPARAVLIELN